MVFVSKPYLGIYLKCIDGLSSMNHPLFHTKEIEVQITPVLKLNDQQVMGHGLKNYILLRHHAFQVKKPKQTHN